MTLSGRATEKSTKKKKPENGVYFQKLLFLLIHLHVYKKAKRIRVEWNHVVNDLGGSYSNDKHT